jgi:hypothetical protein
MRHIFSESHMIYRSMSCELSSVALIFFLDQVLITFFLKNVIVNYICKLNLKCISIYLIFAPFTCELNLNGYIYM